ncbi:hypothetical protein [Pseudonocardia sp. ICBG601]|nr:hypothetical protein [Pseudonocardia sp. ICBG601]
MALQLFTIPVASFAIGHAAYRSGAPRPRPRCARTTPAPADDG